MDFIYFLLASWGLTHILVSSSILKGFRDWCHIRIPFLGRMLECYQCTGFWASLSVYLILHHLSFGSFSFIIKDFNFNLDFLIASLIGSGFCSFMSVLFSRLIVKVK